MDIKTLNTVIAKVTNKVLEGKTVKEVGALAIDGELRTTVIYKDNVYEFVVIDLVLYQALNIKLDKKGVCRSVYIDESCIKDFEHINTLSDLLDDIYKVWETKINELSSDKQEVDKFMDVSI